MAAIKLLSRGNGKLDSSILGWSITPIKSCLNCKDCKASCYATRPYKRWPEVRNAWDRNLAMAKTGTFMEPVIGQIKRSRTVKAVRIHVAGDFFSQDYADKWLEIVKSCPEIRFYGYTKVSHLIDLEPLANEANMNLINSIADDGAVNFGDHDRVESLVSMGYKVCPATVPGNDITCGTDCDICQYEPRVCFHIH